MDFRQEVRRVTESYGRSVHTSRLLSLALGVAFLASMSSVAVVAAASSSVECGQLTGYTAPDSSGPTDGSLKIGNLAAWDVLATAAITAEATSALPTIVNSGPTCLALDFDDGGKVTSIGFVAHGTISGYVNLDLGSGFYVFDDRLVIPPFITDAYPGLAALIVTSDQAATVLSITFSTDTTTGAFTGFDGHANFCGTGTITAGGDGQVGDAVIPAAVLDATDTAALRGAGPRQTCAAVHAVGTIAPDSNGDISIVTDIVITVAPTAPNPTGPPSDSAAGGSTTPGGSLPIALILGVVVLVASLITSRRFRRAPSDRGLSPTDHGISILR